MLEGGVDEYEAVRVRIVAGADPTLSLYDDAGQLVERIDLRAYSSLDALHALFAANGLARTSTLRNHDQQCYAWASNGECVHNAIFMRATCARACAVDHHAACASWARAGECARNEAFMARECPASCAEPWPL